MAVIRHVCVSAAAIKLFKVMRAVMMAMIRPLMPAPMLVDPPVAETASSMWGWKPVMTAMKTTSMLAAVTVNSVTVGMGSRARITTKETMDMKPVTMATGETTMAARVHAI